MVSICELTVNRQNNRKKVVNVWEHSMNSWKGLYTSLPKGREVRISKVKLWKILLGFLMLMRMGSLPPSISVCLWWGKAVMEAEFVLSCAKAESYFNQETPCKAWMRGEFNGRYKLVGCA